MIVSAASLIAVGVWTNISGDGPGFRPGTLKDQRPTAPGFTTGTILCFSVRPTEPFARFGKPKGATWFPACPFPYLWLFTPVQNNGGRDDRHRGTGLDPEPPTPGPSAFVAQPL
jgi:hypothetical protein